MNQLLQANRTPNSFDDFDNEETAPIIGQLKSNPKMHSFVDAWREGVRLYPEFFDVQASSIDEAVEISKLTLRSDRYWSVKFATLTPVDRVFLAAMLSFYDRERGGELLEAVGCCDPATLSSVLDSRRRKIIGALFLSL